MSVAMAIARRECASFFRLPVGWIVIALFLLLSAFTFVSTVVTPGEVATLRGFFQFATFLMIVIAPAISMRLLSEESRSGTLECLLTSPVGDATIIVGKYLGSCMFLVAMLAPTLVYVWLLARLSDPAPDPGPVIAGYLCLVLVGMLYLAIGTLASSLTSTQTLAFLGTFLGLLVLLLGPGLLAPHVPERFASWLMELSVRQRVDDFAKGVIDTSHVVFFLTGSAFFIVLAYLALGSRRWR